MNSNEMRGSDFIYQIDSSYGLSQDGYIATGTESIVYKGLKIFFRNYGEKLLAYKESRFFIIYIVSS